MEENVESLEKGLYESHDKPESHYERVREIAKVLASDNKVTIDEIKLGEGHYRVSFKDVPREDGGYYSPITFELKGRHIITSSEAFAPHVGKLEKLDYIITIKARKE